LDWLDPDIAAKLERVYTNEAKLLTMANSGTGTSCVGIAVRSANCCSLDDSGQGFMDVGWIWVGQYAIGNM